MISAPNTATTKACPPKGEHCNCFLVVERTDKKTGKTISESADPADGDDPKAFTKGAFEKLGKEHPESKYTLVPACLTTNEKGVPLNAKGEPIED